MEALCSGSLLESNASKLNNGTGRDVQYYKPIIHFTVYVDSAK